MQKRILIIDDEPRWIEFARRDLNEFEVAVAKDTEAAIAELAAAPYDVAIVSSRRLDVLKTIRDRFAGTRVVVATVQPTTQEALTAYRLGAVRYCTKSFGLTDLQVCMRGLVVYPSSNETLNSVSQLPVCVNSI